MIYLTPLLTEVGGVREQKRDKQLGSPVLCGSYRGVTTEIELLWKDRSQQNVKGLRFEKEIIK